MFVCHCFGINDKKIISSIRDGADTLHKLELACGAGSNCGRCRPLIRSILEDEKMNQTFSGWDPVISEFKKEYFDNLKDFVEDERINHTVFPDEPDMFTAFKLTKYNDVKVVILGQDPYHGPGQAHGLAFSVKPDVAYPPSLLNIFKELKSDLGIDAKTGCLESWAKQGVFLLNAILTVRAHEAASHRDKGWETFTDAVIEKLSDRTVPMVFILWGGYARSKKALINKRHLILESVHPSPLSARNGFFGSKPFSKANTFLKNNGQEPINWSLNYESVL